MLASITENASPTTHSHYTFDIYDQPPDYPAEAPPLISKIMTAAQSNESLVSITTSTSEFQRICLGVIAGIALGALAATGFHYTRTDCNGSLAGVIPGEAPPF